MSILKNKRYEFSDSQKAKIYVRDRGICAFSGKILWIFHYGISCLRDTDWVDHIKPAMKGGKNIIENGICASSFFNAKKKDNGSDNKFLFKDGKPTFYFYQIHGFIPEELKNYLKDFENLSISDWYLNRAFKNLILTIECLNNPYDLKGNLFKRTEDDWSAASYKNILEWRKKSNNENIYDLLQRLNISENNLGEDQKIMLEIVNVNSFEDIKNIAIKLLPYYKNSLHYFQNDNNNFQTENILSLRDKKVLEGKL